jgi:multidrug efflux pump subunit AcrA (membrane-fusion protein)
MVFLGLIIVLVSGLIAYVGDLVGRKMGRKRLTLLGLRPRHTAIVISVGAGMLIAILTLLTMLAVNKGIRDAFFTPLEQVKDELAHGKQTLTATKQELDAARARLTAQRADLAKIDAQLTQTDTQLKTSDALNRQSQRQLAQLQRKRAELTQALGAVTGDLSTSRARLDNTKHSLLMTSDEYFKQHDQLLKQRDELMNLQLTTQTFVNSNFSPLAFAYGQEILTGLVPPTQTGMQRKILLKRVFTAAEHVVRERSTELPAGASALLFLTEGKDHPEPLDEEDAIDLLAARMAKLGTAEGVIIRLTPVNNVPINGPAFVLVDKVELLPNAPVYTAGSAVARVEIEVGAKTRTADILTSLADDLLRVKLPDALRAKGMLSIARRFDAAHPEATPENSTSTVSWAELMAAVEKARGLTGKVHLIARSRTNVSTYGPLSIAVDVEPAP